MALAASGNLRPWVGSAVVHGLAVAALALAAIQWRTDPPPPQLAIEGNVVRYEDLPSSVKAGKALREPTPVAPVQQAPAPAPVPTNAGELRGHIKFFDTRRGFGFIEMDDAAAMAAHIAVQERGRAPTAEPRILILG